MTTQLDHVIYAARDLEPMCREFESLSGVQPAPGGRHPGLGTRNALASLGDSVYFELLARDPEQPEQPPAGTMGGQIQAFETPRLFAYMVRSRQLEAAQQVLTQHRIDSDLFDASRKTPDGSTLRWRLLVPRDNRFGHFVPKFIDWLDTPHPATVAPKGCDLESFEMGHPDAGDIRKLLQALEVDQPVLSADRPYLHLKIRTPRGSRVLTGHS